MENQRVQIELTKEQAALLLPLLQQIPETPTVGGPGSPSSNGFSPSSVSPGCSSGRPTFSGSSFTVGSGSETDGYSAADLLQKKKKNTKAYVDIYAHSANNLAPFAGLPRFLFFGLRSI